jgi:purine-binding chemotaxis protein CheW
MIPNPSSIDTSPDAAEEMIELIAFEAVPDERFHLPVTMVREIRNWSDPTPLPLSDPVLLGVINMRGTVLPVIDLARALGLSSGPLPAPRVIIVLQDRGRTTGLAVDRVIGFAKIAKSAIESPPVIANHAAGVAIRALAFENNVFMRILDPEALLPLNREDAV